MPLRGAKTLPGFHPFANHFRCESCPVLKPIPSLAEESAAGRQAENPLRAAVLPLRAHNAAIRGYTACRGRCRIEAGGIRDR
ncbi:MAG: hypothetical protein LBK61_12085 [Spirochaetaceae bacterium]|nr:hypothetical protein [Spirochaetaceae bacterium]